MSNTRSQKQQRIQTNGYMQQSRALFSWLLSFANDHGSFGRFVLLLVLVLIGEIMLGSLIILKVKYTEIDWIAYMQEVGGVLGGELDYSKLRGDTGPLVYPAGFVYLYTILYWLTNSGSLIGLAQWIFLGLYLSFISVVLFVYRSASMRMNLPPWWMLLLCLSRRIHSIFMLRLFNDCFAMFFLYIAIACFIKNRWSIGCFLFSIAFSIKMNIILFAPALLLLLWKRFGFWWTLPKLAICAGLQFLLGLPFLLHAPWSYIKGSFDIGRVFKYKWTVNLKFLPEHIFLDRRLHILLLGLHLFVCLIMLNKIYRSSGGIIGVFKNSFCTNSGDEHISANDIVTSMFISNFVGIMFARSLHYQFYVWYYHTLPYLLWLCPYPTIFRVVLLLVIEYIWNVYPAHAISSLSLNVIHLAILIGLCLHLDKKKNNKDQ